MLFPGIICLWANQHSDLNTKYELFRSMKRKKMLNDFAICYRDSLEKMGYTPPNYSAEKAEENLYCNLSLLRTGSDRFRHFELKESGSDLLRVQINKDLPLFQHNNAIKFTLRSLFL
jgi:hypothetical protein